MCMGNEVEILALEIGPELGPEMASAMTIAKNNGHFQEGGQRFDRPIPRVASCGQGCCCLQGNQLQAGR